MNVEIMVNDKIIEKVVSEAIKTKAAAYIDVQVKGQFREINKDIIEKTVKKVLSGIDKTIEDIAEKYLEKILSNKSLAMRVEEATYAELNKQIDTAKMYSFLKNKETGV